MTRTIALLVTAASLSACAASDGVGVGVQAVTSTPTEAAPVLQDDSGADFRLEAGFLHLRDIELDLPSDLHCADVADLLEGAACEASDDPADGHVSGGGGDDGSGHDAQGDDRIVIAGPFDIDLLTGAATPSLDSVVIPAGLYRRVDLRVDDNAGDVSFAATAAFTLADGVPRTLELALDFNEDIRIEDAGGVDVSTGAALVGELVVDAWLGGVDAGRCIAGGGARVEGATLIIDEQSGGACAFEGIIRDNVRASGRIGQR